MCIVKIVLTNVHYLLCTLLAYAFLSVVCLSRFKNKKRMMTNLTAAHRFVILKTNFSFKHAQYRFHRLSEQLSNAFFLIFHNLFKIFYCAFLKCVMCKEVRWEFYILISTNMSGKLVSDQNQTWYYYLIYKKVTFRPTWGEKNDKTIFYPSNINTVQVYNIILRFLYVTNNFAFHNNSWC